MSGTEELFAFKMLDCATPSFCTFSKIYVGALTEIKEVINRMRDFPEYKETVEAFDGFMKGNRTASHTVAYKREPIVEPVEWISSKSFYMKETVWDHINIWGFTYRMKYRSADIERIAIRFHGRNFLYCRASMQDLCYETKEQNWRELNGGFWGNDWVMGISFQPDGHFSVKNILFVEEARFDSTDTMLECMEKDSSIRLTEILNEIFGDG